MNKKIFFSFLLFIFLIIPVFAYSGGYTYSNPITTNGIFSGYTSGFGTNFYESGYFNNSLCQEGTDFLLRVDSLECTPLVVRSDLLEEQDIPVFCPLQAIKINPLISISSIDSISFSGDYPPEVRTVGFTPASSALGGNRYLQDYNWENIGYLTIILRRNANESSMPDYLNLNLTARINYDLEGGFGLMTHNFYLPVLSDYEFDQKAGNYAFFNNMGYLRADDITDDSAKISIYNGLYSNSMDSSSYDRQKVQSFDLKVGESSPKLYLPSIGCLSKVKFTLNKIDYADTSAKLLINSEYSEVRELETFLNGKCGVKNIESNGLYQSVRISCSTDDGVKNFDLRYSPQLVFNVDGKKVNVSLGDKIGTSKEGQDLFFGYLGKNKEGKRVAFVFGLPADFGKNQLSESDLAMASYLGEAGLLEGKSSMENLLNSIAGGAVSLFTNLQRGQSNAFIVEGNSEEIYGSTISFDSLGLKGNEVLKLEYQNMYDKAMEDYNKIISNYLYETYPNNSLFTLAEKAAANRIRMAEEFGQYEDSHEFCISFKQDFPTSGIILPTSCSDDLVLSNEGVATQIIKINSDYFEIRFQGVSEPSFEDYGAIINVKDNSNGKTTSYSLKKNTVVILNSITGESFSLNSISGNEVDIFVNVNKTDLSTKIGSFFSGTQTLPLLREVSFNDQYVFSVQKINQNKMAYVKVEPSISNQMSESSFNHSIGIEKRLIQLTPEKAKSIANEMNNTVNTLNKITDVLDVTVSTLQGACLATGGILTLKNIISSRNGETIARGEVMVKWKEKCSKLVPSKFSNLEACYLNFSDSIDSQVKELADVMKNQEKNLSSIISKENLIIKSGNIIQDGLANSTALSEIFSKTVLDEIIELKRTEGEIMKNRYDLSKTINLTKVELILKDHSLIDKVYGVDELKEIDLYYQMYKKYENLNELDSKEIYYDKMFSSIDKILIYSSEYSSLESSQKENEISRTKIKILNYASNKAIVGTYFGYKVLAGDELDKKGIPVNIPIQAVQLDDGEIYYIYLEPSGIDNTYMIKEVYDYNGKALGSQGISIVKKAYSSFVLANSGSYNYEILSSDYYIRYYEYGAYTGYPGILPFDKYKGWYVSLETGLTSVSSYQESGRVQSFNLCNVMEDGLIGLGDTCVTINLASSKYVDFPGLTSSETQKLIDTAVNAISTATKVSNKKGNVPITNSIGKIENVPIGVPYSSSSSSTTCSDFMSPKECQLLFNLCDPVICPSSRCNYGGKYNVQNVIQSGVIGSIMLCLPNFNEGIYAPVCLSGVNAGLKGLTSVSEAYRDCLEENIQTGNTVGICDEIHSIYLCEFLWKQAIPLVKIATPSILSRVVEGVTVRGGGEYYSIKDAWENAKESIDYFTETYAVQSYKAFKARSTDQVGTGICKTFISVPFPTSLGSLDALAQSSNPAQFIASLEETIYSSATNPPMSQYKVSYHIYSGEDSGTYYSIYLRGTSGSYYEDSSEGRRIDSGYIDKGKYLSEKVDFLATSGYSELCVRINDEEEECGFGTVSSNFAVNLLSDAYIESESSNTDIKTADECMSGSSNLLSLLNTNLQSGISNTLDPNIVAEGIIRICATSNPGTKTDPLISGEDSKWVDVGYCDDPSMRCWIDRDSLKEAFNYEYSYNEVLNSSLAEASQKTIEQYLLANSFWNEGKFSIFWNNLTSNNDSEEKIDMINSAFDYLYYNNHKAASLLIRGDSYWRLLRNFKEIQELNRNQTGVVDNLNLNSENLYASFSSSNYVSPVFYLSGLNGGILFMAYNGSSWVYSNNVSSIVSGTGANPTQMSNNIQESFLKYFSEDYSRLNGKISGSNDAMNSFLTSMKDRDYLKGIQKMLALVENQYSGSDSSSLFELKEIRTQNGTVVIDKERRVKVNNSNEIIYFAYIDGSWKWSFRDQDVLGEDNWISIKESTQKYKTWLVINKEYTISSKYDSLRKLLSDSETNEFKGLLIIISGPNFWSQQETLNNDPEAVYDVLIKQYANEYKIDPALVKAVIKQESNFNTYAVSYTGCAGLMQFCYGTAKDYSDIFGSGLVICSKDCSCSISCDSNKIVNSCGCSLNDPRFDPSKSINAGSAYLSKLNLTYYQYSDGIIFALVGYNAGPGVSNKLILNLKNSGKTVNWENAKSILTEEFLSEFYSSSVAKSKVNEIKNYVEKVMAYYSSYSSQGGDSFIVWGASEELDLGLSEGSSGEIILENAVSCLGEDASRTEGGREVYDNVCATFVSDVLIQSGALPELTETSRDAVVELYNLFKASSNYSSISSDSWLQGLKPGDVIIWGSNQEQYKSDFQHISIFRKYDSSGNFIVIHDGGEKDSSGNFRPIEETTYSLAAHNAGAWAIKHVYRYIGPNLGNKPVYTFDELNISSDLEEEAYYGEVSDLIQSIEGFGSTCPVNGNSFLFTGNAITTSNTPLLVCEPISCTNSVDCQKKMGEVIYNISDKVGIKYKLSDESIKKETGYKNFECLMLGLAYTESRVRFCKNFHENNNPLYCEGNIEKVIGWSKTYIPGLGTFQINPKSDGYETDYKYFLNNVNRGLSIYLAKLKIASKAPNGRIYTCLNETYSGHQLAIRYYNGWNVANCAAGDKNYVEKVLGYRAEVENLFPQCK